LRDEVDGGAQVIPAQRKIVEGMERRLNVLWQKTSDEIAMIESWALQGLLQRLDELEAKERK
jgi:hypothetical protein